MANHETGTQLTRDVMDVREVAEFLGLHPRTVCAYIREGKIRAIRCGRYYRIRRAWVDEFLDAQEM